MNRTFPASLLILATLAFPALADKQPGPMDSCRIFTGIADRVVFAARTGPGRGEIDKLIARSHQGPEVTDLLTDFAMRLNGKSLVHDPLRDLLVEYRKLTGHDCPQPTSRLK